MKFDARAVSVLKNFAQINQSIIFRPGSIVRTVSQSKAVYAMATISAEIDETYAIYDLNQYLSAIALVNDGEVVIENNKAIITASKERVEYPTTDQSLILAAPDKSLKLPSVDVQFTMDEAAFSKAMKALGTLRLPELGIVGDGEKVYLAAINSKERSGAAARLEVGETDKEFKLYFLAANLNLIPGDYEVTVCSKGMAQFESADVTYWVAVEQNSEFPN